MDGNVRPKRNIGFSTSQMDSERRCLNMMWSGLILAGEQNDDLDITSEGTHACAARAIMLNRDVIEGSFDSEDCHAEMNLLQNVIAAGYQLDEISKIEIEKQPCPRCAVILNVLHLGNKVKYKKSGQKDYPTWRFPNMQETVNWAARMEVGAEREDQQAELLNYFCTNKWWR